MRFRIRVTGGNKHYNVDLRIDTDSFERVESIRRFADRNSFQFKVEVI